MNEENLNEQGSLSFNSENLFPIIKKWLYSDQEIFIRELVSNGVDAIGKRKTLIGLGQAQATDEELKVTVSLSKKEKTLTVSDNGIGMTAEEVKKYINQVAFSGAAEFMEKYKSDGADAIIGHFGLGFYSAFMVADLVEIETLSATEGAVPVHWSCDGSSAYEMREGSRTAIGTDIILHINEDGKKYLKSEETRAILDKYCSFMASPVYFEAERVNAEESLWTKNPKDCTDEEYKDFYRKVFRDFKEPLFWIHLNMDYPFRLQGILYFPKLSLEFESAEGQVKLYCNQVFVADNVKEIIPDFLLLLKGAIDCPDLPLNVSRSFLQNDGYVQKVSDYITRKVGDKLCSLYKKERESYEKYWEDIHPFIKYGCLRNEKFLKRVSDCIIYKSVVSDSYITLPDYLEAAKETHENKVFYTSDATQQAGYIELAKSRGMDVIELDTGIDAAFITQLEEKNEGVKFFRVDADVKAFTQTDEAVEDLPSEEDISALKTLFETVLAKENMKLRMEKLGADAVPSMMEQSEEMRRFGEMMRLYSRSDMGMPEEEPELVLNAESAIVKHLMDISDKTTPSDTDRLLVSQLYALAKLSFTKLSADELKSFLSGSKELMERII